MFGNELKDSSQIITLNKIINSEEAELIKTIAFDKTNISDKLYPQKIISSWQVLGESFEQKFSQIISEINDKSFGFDLQQISSPELLRFFPGNYLDWKM